MHDAEEAMHYVARVGEKARLANQHFCQKTEGSIMSDVDRIMVGANDVSQPDS